MLTRMTLVVFAVWGILGGTAYGDPLALEVKWRQLPEMTPNGYGFSSESQVPSAVADDFLCEDARAIVDVHWWGGYYRTSDGMLDHNSDHYGDPSFAGPGADAVMPGIVGAFVLSIYADVPADPERTEMPYSHPGALLYSETVPMSSVTWNLYGVIDRNSSGVYGDDGDLAVWQYSVILSRAFEQAPGTVYWLSIVAVNDGAVNPTGIQWGWLESADHWNDTAVQQGPPEEWGNQYSAAWANLAVKDMAFELSVPEPATMALVGGGLGMVFMMGRRRRR